MSRPKASLRAEQDELRTRMRDRGMTHQEIAAEFARRYRLRPRAAHRYAFGWTLTQAADRINAYAAEHGLDPAGKAPMTEPKLSELENFPRSRVRRLMPQTLALLAGVYGTDVHALLDLDDHDRLTPSDRLLLSTVSASVAPHSHPCRGPGRTWSVCLRACGAEGGGARQVFRGAGRVQCDVDRLVQRLP